MRLWPTWDGYLATGKQFVAAGTGAGFFDAAGGSYQNILMQQGDTTYFDRSNNLIADTNPGVRKAWDQAVGMIDAGLSGKLQMWGSAWNAGFKRGTFATIPCPAWMPGIIKDQAGPENAGLIAIVPAAGGVRAVGPAADRRHHGRRRPVVMFYPLPTQSLRTTR